MLRRAAAPFLTSRAGTNEKLVQLGRTEPLVVGVPAVRPALDWSVGSGCCPALAAACSSTRPDDVLGQVGRRVEGRPGGRRKISHASSTAITVKASMTRVPSSRVIQRPEHADGTGHDLPIRSAGAKGNSITRSSSIPSSACDSRLRAPVNDAGGEQRPDGLPDRARADHRRRAIAASPPPPRCKLATARSTSPPGCSIAAVDLDLNTNGEGPGDVNDWHRQAPAARLLPEHHARRMLTR